MIVSPSKLRRSFLASYEEPRNPGPLLSVWDRGAYRALTWDDWRTQAEGAAVGLRSRGIALGDRVAAVLTNGAAIPPAVVGVWLAGGCVVSMPTISRGTSPGEYARLLRTICREAQVSLLVAEEAYVQQLGAAGPGVPVVAAEELQSSGVFEPSPPDADDIAFVQYSSGSTTRPRGCMLSVAAISAQLDMLAEALDLDAGAEQGVSWLPLSHDMGFFGCLMLAFAKGMRLALGTPARFLRAPRTWLEDCARFRATITAAPCSSLELAARAAVHDPPAELDLRKLVLGGERVCLRTLEHAMDALGPAGLTWNAFLPAYGLAEAVLAVTMTSVADAPRSLALRTDALLEGTIEPAQSDDHNITHCVSLGPPIGDAAVWIDGSAIGEVRLETPSLASGYVGEPAATRERFQPAGLRTGDMGFLDGEELFVLGRSDEVICVAGRKIFAGEVEAELNLVPGVRNGCCLIVEVPERGRYRPVIIAESDADVSERVRVAQQLRLRAARRSGLAPAECWLLPPRTLPKTPSGKLRRFRCRQLAGAGQLPVTEKVCFE